MTSKSPFSKVDHVGVVVRDMNKAVEYYQSLGIGPFEVLTGIVPGDKRMWGKPVSPDDFKLNEKMASIGPIWLQLIQPVAGDSVWKEFLDTRGEGVHHVSFQVDDIEGMYKTLTNRGVKFISPPVWVTDETHPVHGWGAAYFWGPENIILELMQAPK